MTKHFGIRIRGVSKISSRDVLQNIKPPTSCMNDAKTCSRKVLESGICLRTNQGNRLNDRSIRVANIIIAEAISVTPGGIHLARNDVGFPFG